MSINCYVLLSRFLSRIVLEKLTTYSWVELDIVQKGHGRKGKNIHEDGWKLLEASWV